MFETIYVNEDNIICERYPFFKPITNSCRKIILDKEKCDETRYVAPHYCWYYIDGDICCQQYEDIPTDEENAKTCAECHLQLNETDYKVIKALETMFLSDTELHKTRQEWRDKINELEE